METYSAFFGVGAASAPISRSPGTLITTNLRFNCLIEVDYKTVLSQQLSNNTKPSMGNLTNESSEQDETS